jgi:site-specific recombinase XerD
MTQQLSLFAESATDEPTEDTARARWDKRLDNFENWLRSLNKAKRTIRGYTTDTCAGAGVGQLLDFLEQEGRLEDLIDTDDLIDFLAEQQKQGARSRTLDRKRSAFKAFFGYLVRFNRIDADPSRRLGVPIADYELPLALTESEVEGLLEAARDHPRDLAILRLFTSCGLRVSELCGLKPVLSLPKGWKTSTSRSPCSTSRGATFPCLLTPRRISRCG